jgi:hypothetical protein
MVSIEFIFYILFIVKPISLKQTLRMSLTFSNFTLFEQQPNSIWTEFPLSFIVMVQIKKGVKDDEQNLLPFPDEVSSS